MASLQDLVTAAGAPCARPDSMLSLMEIIEDPLVDAHTLIPVVNRDPGLTAGLLKLCNSSLYGFKRHIGSVNEALVLVGNRTFARLCFTLSLKPALHRTLPGYNLDLDDLWLHSLATAYGSAFLVGMSGRDAMRDRAFTAGLLHDIGKLVLDSALAVTDDAPVAVRITREMEVARAGCDHAEAGATMLDSWELPDQIVEAVKNHHDCGRSGASVTLSDAVHVADKVAHVAGRLRPGSGAMAAWVNNACREDPFAPDTIGGLAERISAASSNIMSLAVGVDN